MGIVTDGAIGLVDAVGGAGGVDTGADEVVIHHGDDLVVTESAIGAG